MRVRVLFRAPPDFQPGANIWCQAEPVDHGLAVTLDRAYPDFQPTPGHHLEIGASTYEVQSVADLTVTAVLLEGNP